VIDLSTLIRTSVQPSGPHLVSGMSSSGGHLAVFASGHLAYFQTTHNTSTAVVLRSGAGTSGTVQVVSTGDKSPTIGAFIQPKLVTFPSPDGKFTVHAQLFEPPPSASRQNSDGVRPGVIFTHGGCQRQMYAAFHYSPTYGQLYALNQHLAATGSVVLSINYRGGPGYGVAFRAANGSGWQVSGPSQGLHPVLCLSAVCRVSPGHPQLVHSFCHTRNRFGFRERPSIKM
jgi:dipeptidyl aminopeptidase/acylaminoacyl peptidase